MLSLYVIAHKDEEENFVAPVKIGVTNNLDRRLREIQTGNPSKVGYMQPYPIGKI